uniref:SH3 domain-binding glutamic acid-rich protein n=1 Tax=Anopheles atroparvus TaxID=41427 RepID=A0AAG5DHQ1_ANOAO
MVIKVYVSGMSGNKEVKKRQQRVTMIMDSKHIEYTVIDITEPGQEGEKDFMQVNAQHKGCTISDPNPRHALPPQLFNDTEYCGDYDDFDMANEVDNLEVFLKLAAPAVPEVEHKNGGTTGEEATEATDAVVDDDENKENKTEDNADGGAVVAEAATEDGANEEPPNAVEMDAEPDDEEEELLKTSAALAGKSEDAEEIDIEEAEEEEAALQPDQDDAAEDGISSKLVDTDDPMLAEQEQEE